MTQQNMLSQLVILCNITNYTCTLGTYTPT